MRSTAASTPEPEITHVWPLFVHVTALRPPGPVRPRRLPSLVSGAPCTIVYAIVRPLARVEHGPHRAALDDVGPGAHGRASSRSSGNRAPPTWSPATAGAVAGLQRDRERVVDRRAAAGDEHEQRRGHGREAEGGHGDPAAPAPPAPHDAGGLQLLHAQAQLQRRARVELGDQRERGALLGERGGQRRLGGHAGLDLGAARGRQAVVGERDQVRLVLGRQVWVLLSHIPLPELTPQAGALFHR